MVNAGSIGGVVKNLRQDPGKKFWLIDNEYSVYVGYNALFNMTNHFEDTQQFRIHEHIIKSLCVFNENIVKRIQWMADMKSPYEYLLEYIRDRDPLFHKMETSNRLFVRHEVLFKTRFHGRLKGFMMWANFCASI